MRTTIIAATTIVLLAGGARGLEINRVARNPTNCSFGTLTDGAFVWACRSWSPDPLDIMPLPDGTVVHGEIPFGCSADGKSCPPSAFVHQECPVGGCAAPTDLDIVPPRSVYRIGGGPNDNTDWTSVGEAKPAGQAFVATATAGCGVLGFPPCQPSGQGMACVLPGYHWALTGGCVPDAVPTDLDRAMAICRGHQIPDGTVIVTNPPTLGYQYASGWHACLKIEDEWGKSAAAKAERDRQAAEQRDLDFVNRIAGESCNGETLH